MSKSNKDKLLENRQKFVKRAQNEIKQEEKKTEELFIKQEGEQVVLELEDLLLNEMGRKRKRELQELAGTPFFKRLLVKFKDESEPREVHISKFSVSQIGIYSWVMPIASMRFSDLGDVGYKKPNGEMKEGTLSESEDFTIVDSQIVYYSRLDENGQELVYQKHFTEKLKGFGLAEIVSQMEKLQDTIIRAKHKGPMLISGPAGSGKTTVALHRVAYLKQSPETSEYYPDRSCVVLVQDKSSEEYFSKLLPDLGIYGVEISTFAQWGRKLLDLGDEYEYIERFGDSFREKNEYEYLKVGLISNNDKLPKYYKDPFTTLRSCYKSMPKRYRDMLEAQRKDQVLDKQDITLLLKAYKKSKGEVQNTVQYYKKIGGGQVEKKHKRVKTKYASILVDEFQNYTPDQLSLIRMVLDDNLRSITYVGDLNQQTHIGSIQNWDQIGESFGEGRTVKLDKVYRNSEAILNLLDELDYEVQHSTNDKKAGGFAKVNVCDEKNEFNDVLDVLKEAKRGSQVCIIAFEESYLSKYKEHFDGDENIHVLPVNKVQGLEFDTVCLVGLNSNLFDPQAPSDINESYTSAYGDTVRDYLYVACTRAITNLHIYTRDKLKPALVG